MFDRKQACGKAGLSASEFILLAARAARHLARVSEDRSYPASVSPAAPGASGTLCPTALTSRAGQRLLRIIPSSDASSSSLAMPPATWVRRRDGLRRTVPPSCTLRAAKPSTATHPRPTQTPPPHIETTRAHIGTHRHTQARARARARTHTHTHAHTHVCVCKKTHAR